ncbi:hypothetical protein VTO73DRAFT_4838 [Trametes versicolor]
MTSQPSSPAPEEGLAMPSRASSPALEDGLTVPSPADAPETRGSFYTTIRRQLLHRVLPTSAGIAGSQNSSGNARVDMLMSLLPMAPPTQSAPRTISSVIARLNDPLAEVNFQLPNAYAELTASISRWHRWLDLVDPAAGGELLPADTSEGERTALRRLATALMYFSAARAASPSDEHEEDFLTGLQRTSRLEEFAAASRHADVVLDWVGEEFVAFQDWSRAWLVYDPMTAAGSDVFLQALLQQAPPPGPAPAAEDAVPNELMYAPRERDEGYLSEDSDGSVPSLQTISDSGSDYQ